MKHTRKAATAFAEKPDQNVWAALIHCADAGVARECADTLAGAWSAGAPVEQIRLTEDEISRDRAVLGDTLEARSLLGDARILTIALTNEKLSKRFTDLVEAVEDSGRPFETRLILVTGSLKAASKLRKTFEAANHAVAMQLFADEAGDVRALVVGELEAAGQKIDDDALERLCELLPGHRQLARMEIEKLVLYGRGLDRPLTVADVLALQGSDVDHALYTLVTAAFAGHARKAVTELERLSAAGTSPISILRALQREAVLVLSAHADGVRDSRAAMRLRPPVFASQWPAFETRMQAWSGTSLTRLVARIHETEATAKLAGPVAPALVARLISDMVRRAQAA